MASGPICRGANPSLFQPACFVNSLPGIMELFDKMDAPAALETAAGPSTGTADQQPIDVIRSHNSTGLNRFCDILFIPLFSTCYYLKGFRRTDVSQ